MTGFLPPRRHPVHGILSIGGQTTIIFDSVCTKGRAAWLAYDAVHQLLRDVWTDAAAWVVGRYVIMPDHVHYFAAATDSVIRYENWVKYWKSKFTKQHKVVDHRWQTDHWDRRVRSAGDYEERTEYMLDNPRRKGLVVRNEDWPFQGELYELRWD
jgi:putative transposase